MAFEQKELTGALFEKHDKEGKQPDFTGNVKIEGKEWRLAGWWTESRGGETYMSLKVTDPEEFRRSREQPSSKPIPPPRRMNNEQFFQKRREIQADAKQRAAGDTDIPDDDDIPF